MSNLAKTSERSGFQGKRVWAPGGTKSIPYAVAPCFKNSFSLHPCRRPWALSGTRSGAGSGLDA